MRDGKFDGLNENTYSADYRNVYIKDEDKIIKRKKAITNPDETKQYVKFEADVNTYESSECTQDTSSEAEERTVDNILSEIVVMIKMSFRIFSAVFMIVLCIGLLCLTAYLMNTSLEELEKNHLPYTLLCILRGDESYESD